MNTWILFKPVTKSLIRDALKVRDFFKNGEVLHKAADIIRKYWFEHESLRLSYSFSENCQQRFIPASLKYCIAKMLHRTSMQDQDPTDQTYKQDISCNETHLFLSRLT